MPRNPALAARHIERARSELNHAADVLDVDMDLDELLALAFLAHDLREVGQSIESTQERSRLESFALRYARHLADGRRRAAHETREEG